MTAKESYEQAWRYLGFLVMTGTVSTGRSLSLYVLQVRVIHRMKTCRRLAKGGPRRAVLQPDQSYFFGIALCGDW